MHSHHSVIAFSSLSLSLSLLETLLTTRSRSYNFEDTALIMEDPEFIEHYTNKGGTAAIFEGFAYIKDVNLSDEKLRFKCIHYPKCKSYIWIRHGKAMIFPHGSRLGREHNHEVEPDSIAAKQRLKTFKEHARVQPHAHVAALVADARDCETVVANAMPSSSLLARTGRRIKRKVSCFRLRYFCVIIVLIYRSSVQLRK